MNAVGLKGMFQGLFKALGVEVHLAAKGGSYTLCPPYGYSTYSPWFEPEFQAAYDRIKQRTVVTEDRVYLVQKLAEHALHLDGHFAECGVYKGGTAYLLGETMASAGAGNRRLHLFDTFTGMPRPEVESIHDEGDFDDTSEESVRKFLEPFPFVEIHAGFIPDTFAPLQDERFAFAHVDVDIYQSMLDCCAFLYPRMTPGGVMLFDDYGLPAYRLDGKRGVDEYFADKVEKPIVLRTGQCLVLKV